MAIRKLEIPGKLITTAGLVDEGPAGEFAVDSSDDAGLTQVSDNITGIQNTTQFTFSAWLLHPSTPTTTIVFEVDAGASNPELRLSFGPPNNAVVLVGTPEGSNSTSVFAQTDKRGDSLDTNAWYHLLISVDTALGSGEATKIYLNDTKLTLSTDSSNGGSLGIATDDNDFYIANDRTGVASLSSNLCMSAFWFDIDRRVDLDIEANRRKFINADGRPLALGTDGSRPFGEAPLLYFDNPIATWNVNRGSGGNFRFVSGNDLDVNAWTTCDSSPDTGTLGT